MEKYRLRLICCMGKYRAETVICCMEKYRAETVICCMEKYRAETVICCMEKCRTETWFLVKKGFPPFPCIIIAAFQLDR